MFVFCLAEVMNQDDILYCLQKSVIFAGIESCKSPLFATIIAGIG